MHEVDELGTGDTGSFCTIRMKPQRGKFQRSVRIWDPGKAWELLGMVNIFGQVLQKARWIVDNQLGGRSPSELVIGIA